jgi:ankyrin repeat protein
MNHQNLFISACDAGDLALAKVLIDFDKNINVHYDKERSFKSACRNNHYHVVLWLLDNFKIEVHSEDDLAFRWCCQFGNFKIAKLLQENFDVYIHALDDYAFNHACYSGHLDIAKWLYDISLSDKKIKVKETTFIYACQYGHLPVVKWLVEISNGELNIRCNNDKAFKESCSEGRLDVAKYLFELSVQLDDVIYVKDDDHFALRWSCYGNHLSTAKWLFETFYNNNNFNFKGILVWCVHYDKKDVVEWIKSINHNNVYVEDEIKNQSTLKRKLSENDINSCKKLKVLCSVCGKNNQIHTMKLTCGHDVNLLEN